MTTAEIITIGTEIMLGQMVDTNAPHIAKSLTGKGVRVLFQTSVGDDKELLASALRIAGDRVNLIITTGGLGPTANDITRETVSEFFGVPLVLDKEAHMHVQKCLADRQVNMLDEHKKQALIPDGAFVISNENGTATGFAIRYGAKEIVCLPGVPGEMQSMLKKYLEIDGERCKTDGGYTLTRSLHTFGISERTVEDRVKDCLTNKGQTKAMTLVHDGMVTIHILAAARERENAVKLLDSTEHDLRKEFGHAIFGVGDETLEYAVAALLKKRNTTIAVAESCTGGLVSDKLTDVPGISEYFLEGVVAYSNKAKVDILGVPEELILRHGAVSPQVAQAMAEGIKKKGLCKQGCRYHRDCRSYRRDKGKTRGAGLYCRCGR